MGEKAAIGRGQSNYLFIIEKSNNGRAFELGSSKMVVHDVAGTKGTGE